MASYTAASAGLYTARQAITATGSGFYRAANDALARYELFTGDGAAPDFTAAATETFSSLPHTTTTTFAASKTWHIVLRLRNKYGLLSQNIGETLIEIDAGGDQVATRPSDPISVSVAAAASGKANVLAQYSSKPDGSNAADTWLVFSTDDGSNPDPDVDVPATETMVFSGGLANLDYLTAAADDDDTIKVIVRTRRIDAGPVNIDSRGTTIHSITANTDGPATVSGGIFIRIDMEQAQ